MKKKMGRPRLSEEELKSRHLGRRFGRLVIVEILPGDAATTAAQRRVYCSCDCGGFKITALSTLATGTVNSCGCLRYTTRPVPPHIDVTEYINKGSIP